jgi:hypothetical protein
MAVTEEALMGALRQADASGDTRSAQMYADRIKGLRAASGVPVKGTDSLGGGDGLGHQVYTALHDFEDTVTSGVGDRIAAAGASALTHVLPVDNQSYEQAYANIKETAANASQGSPITSLIASGAGMLVGGAGIAKAGKFIPALGRALEVPEKAGVVARVARQAAIGGGFGAASAVAHGENVDNAVLATGEGMIAGPLLAKAGTAITRKLLPASQRGIMLLAEKIGEPPDVVQRAMDNFRLATSPTGKAADGRMPTIAELLSAKSQGELRQLAEGSTTVGAALMDAETGANAARSTALGQKIAQIGGPAENIRGLLTARKENMTDAMKPINDKAVTVNTNDVDLLSDPRVRASFANGSPLRAKLATIVGNLTAPGQASDDLSVKEIDQIRQAIRGKQAAFSNPVNTLHNPHTAKEYGDLANEITELGTRQYPEYATNLQNFAADSDYIHGFRHGMKGKGLGEADRTEVINALGRRSGQLGFRSGVSSRLANTATGSDTGAVRVAKELTQPGSIAANTEAFGAPGAAALAAAGDVETRGATALARMTPGHLTPPEDHGVLGHAGHTIAAVASHNPVLIGYHMSRVFGGKVHMSPGVADTVARYLADPKMTQPGINILKKAGASNADINRLLSSISAFTGLSAGRLNEEH